MSRFIARSLTVSVIAASIGFTAAQQTNAIAGERLVRQNESVVDVSADGNTVLTTDGAAGWNVTRVDTGQSIPFDREFGGPPMLSADGASLVLATTESKAAADTDTTVDIYRYTISSGTYALLSGSLQFPTNWGFSGRLLDMDDDGSVVVLSAGSGALALVRVAVVDLRAGTVAFPDALATETSRRQSNRARISADGRYVVWSSYVVAGARIEQWWFDRLANTVSLVSARPNGTSVSDVGNSPEAGISPDGRYVAFVSDAPGLVVGVTTASDRLYLRDVRTRTTRLVASGVGIDGLAERMPAVSVGGRFVSAMLNRTATPSDGSPFENPSPFVVDTTSGALLDLGRSNATGQPEMGRNVIVSADGTDALFTVYDFATETHITSTAPIDTARRFPVRVVDTRANQWTIDGRFAEIGARAVNSTLTVPIVGRAQIPAGIRGVMLNVTVTGAAAPGSVLVHSCLPTAPDAESLTFRRGVTRANSVLATPNAAGNVCFTVRGGTAHLIVDVVDVALTTSTYRGVRPARILDTRPTGNTVDALSRRQGVRAGGTTTTVNVRGRASIPSNARTAVLNVGVVNPAAGGFLTVWQCGSARPNASSLNFVAGQSASSSVVVGLSAAGTVCVYNSAATNVFADVFGSWPVPPEYTTLAAPARLVDTRPTGVTVDGLQRRQGLRAAGTSLEVQVGGRVGMPAGGFTAALNVTIAGATKNGHVTAYPCGGPVPNSSNVNVMAGQTVNNLTWAPIAANGRVCLYTSVDAHIIVDVSGRRS